MKAERGMIFWRRNGLAKDADPTAALIIPWTFPNGTKTPASRAIVAGGMPLIIKLIECSMVIEALAVEGFFRGGDVSKREPIIEGVRVVKPKPDETI